MLTHLLLTKLQPGPNISRRQRNIRPLTHHHRNINMKHRIPNRRSLHHQPPHPRSINPTTKDTITLAHPNYHRNKNRTITLHSRMIRRQDQSINHPDHLDYLIIVTKNARRPSLILRLRRSRNILNIRLNRVPRRHSRNHPINITRIQQRSQRHHPNLNLRQIITGLLITRLNTQRAHPVNPSPTQDMNKHHILRNPRPRRRRTGTITAHSIRRIISLNRIRTTLLKFRRFPKRQNRHSNRIRLTRLLNNNFRILNTKQNKIIRLSTRRRHHHTIRSRLPPTQLNTRRTQRL